jgi:hypothetical protein
MGPKYAKRQKVRIISAKNQQSKPKYPQIEKHVSESGTVIGCYRFGISEPYRQMRRPGPRISDHYLYTIQLDKDGSEIRNVPEGALELLR